ncbi:MAG: hypothetical protein IKP07_04010 [Bacilli bacterium]|nr:hypothetical protein [Bacilli bacterium]
MEIKVKSYSQQSSLISSILFFILGAMFFNAKDVANAIIFWVGIFLAVMAVIELVIFIVRYRKAEFVEDRPKLIRLAWPVATAALAVIFIFFYSVVEQFIRFIIGFWILFTGIIRLIHALSFSPRNKKFLPLLIVAVLIIAVGIYTIVKDNILLQGAGLIMMIYAVIEIIGFIFYSKNNIDSMEPGTETLIVPDKNEKEDKKKKNVKTITHTEDEKKD